MFNIIKLYGLNICHINSSFRKSFFLVFRIFISWWTCVGVCRMEKALEGEMDSYEILNDVFPSFIAWTNFRNHRRIFSPDFFPFPIYQKTMGCKSNKCFAVSTINKFYCMITWKCVWNLRQSVECLLSYNWIELWKVLWIVKNRMTGMGFSIISTHIIIYRQLPYLKF